MWKFSLVILGAITAGLCHDRKFTTSVNPGCRTCDSNITLVYTRCDGPDDTVHQVWDFTLGKPTVLFAVTNTDTNLTINWWHDWPQSFKWSNDPKYSFALVINEIWLYNDINDTGVWKPEYETRVLDLSGAYWERMSLKYGEDEVELTMRTEVRYTQNETGSVSIGLNLLPYTDFGSTLPHLIHSANSSLMEVSADGLQAAGYNSTRLALKLLMASTDRAGEKLDLNVRRSLDDEHTPGIFEIVELTTPKTTKHGDGGFIQYRPVVYTAKYREVTASTVVQIGRVNKTPALPANSTVEMFFKDYEQENVMKEAIMISFGETGDGFYTRTNYTSWDFTVGYGSPPLEGFSTYVILVISVGLAVPAVLLVAGAVYILTRRRVRATVHERLLD